MLRLDFGEGALKEEDKGALFKVVGRLCVRLFGNADLSRSFRDSSEIVNVDGEYAKVSRQIIRNIGCVVGTVVWVEYFTPSEDAYVENFRDLNYEYDYDDDDDDSFLGKYVAMRFDSTDGSFYKIESQARLYTDEEGAPSIEELHDYCRENDNKDEEFEDFLDNEAKTPTVDDYFIINTARLILEKKTLA